MKKYLELWETLPRGTPPPNTSGGPRRGEYVPLDMIIRASSIIAHRMLRGENEDEYQELMEKTARWRLDRREFLDALERPGELEFSDWSVSEFTPQGRTSYLMLRHGGEEGLDLSRQDAERLIQERDTWRLVIPGWTETTEMQRREVLKAVSRWLTDTET